MKEVSICVGSSCHLKGAHDVVKIFQRMVKKHNLENELHLKASFCQGRCTDGVVITVDGEFITGVSPENAREIFYNNFINDGGDNKSENQNECA